jgi:NADPH2:quinone reductase
VQIAKAAGARVIAVVGGEAKAELVARLGADHVVDHHLLEGERALSGRVKELTGDHGVDVVFDNVGDAVFDASVKCTAYNGRYVMMGFASDKTKADEPYFVPRQIMAGNIKLCGVLLAYAQPEIATFVKQAMGFNFVDRASGERMMESVIDLVLEGAVKPVIGSVVDFNDLPAAIDAMAKRNTTGRTIILV